LATAAPASVKAVKELTDEDINVLLQPFSDDIKNILKAVMILLGEQLENE